MCVTTGKRLAFVEEKTAAHTPTPTPRVKPTSLEMIDQYVEDGDDRRRYEHHVQRDQYAEDGVETFVEAEHEGVDEADEVNVFSVHCSAETTAKYIAKAEDDEDSDDDGCPSAISSSDEEGDDEDDEEVTESDSMPSAAATAPSPIGNGPALRHRINGFAVVPPPATLAGEYYRKFPINELTSPMASVSTAIGKGVAALSRSSNDSPNPLKSA